MMLAVYLDFGTRDKSTTSAEASGAEACRIEEGYKKYVTVSTP
jgi:hypothetical protein